MGSCPPHYYCRRLIPIVDFLLLNRVGLLRGVGSKDFSLDFLNRLILKGGLVGEDGLFGSSRVVSVDSVSPR